MIDSNMLNMAVAATIFVCTYTMFITEKVHRTVAAMFGAVLMGAAGVLLNFYSLEDAASSIDMNTIGLLMGMMIIIGVLTYTGLFSFIALKAAKKAKADPWKVMVMFIIITGTLSAFLDNVTTILFMVPITISIAKKIEVRPVPYILAEILASNIGGTATLIGDPPNIIIGTRAHIPFNAFITHLSPIVLISLFLSLPYFKRQYAEDLAVKARRVERIMNMDEWKEIKDWPLLKKGLVVLSSVIVLFLFQDLLHIESSIIALSGAAVLLFITRVKIEEIVLHHIEWPTLLFFGGLFVMVGGLEHSGALDIIAVGISDATGGNLYLTAIIIIWVAASVSAVVDNIPFTITMIPVIMELSSEPVFSSQIADYAVNPLWWALSVGACFGGNATLVGASANVVAVGISDKMGEPITFKEFLRVGTPYTIITTLIGTVVLLIMMFLKPPGF